MKTLTFSLKTLLLIDGLSAIFSAALTLVLASYLEKLLMLPSALLQVFSVVTIVYGSIALVLMNRSPLHWTTRTFVFANGLWVAGCFVLTVLNYSTTNAMGISFFMMQALFVIVLTTLQTQQLKRLE